MNSCECKFSLYVKIFIFNNENVYVHMNVSTRSVYMYILSNVNFSIFIHMYVNLETQPHPLCILKSYTAQINKHIFIIKLVLEDISYLHN